jgi:hypothetical protein
LERPRTIASIEKGLSLTFQLSRRRILAAAIAVLAVSAPAAQACEGTSSKPFTRWLDPFSYTLVPGGTFEDGSPDWDLTGASVVAGNESYNVSGAGSRSLSLPRGASATSPAFCGGIGYPTVRLFAKGGGLLGLLSVTVHYLDGAGVLRSQSLGIVTASGGWQPSLPMLTLAGLPLLTGSQLTISVTAVGGSFTVDDVYVDPWMRH